MFHRSILTAAVLATLCSYGGATELVEIAAVPGVRNAADTLAGAAPTSAETTARIIQKWLTQIKSPYANQLGSGNGTGVVVGIVDSGAQIDHPLLTGQFAAKYNAFNATEDVTDQLGHGTHVAGLVAGTTTNGVTYQGVAPGAKIAMAKVFATGASDTVTIGKGIDWVVNVQKAPILSLSLGSAAVALMVPMKNAVAQGTLITAALGNSGTINGANWPAEFAKEGWANGQIIAVGAVDDNNKRASFSSYDPTLAKWTVYAPGVNIASSYSSSTVKNVYAFMSGTSMATPIVAGQAALIKSNWNFLTAPDIAQVIFQSATHLCSDAVSASVCLTRTTPDGMYGWGLINVEASLQPIGGLNMGTKAGAVVSYAGSVLATAKSGMMTKLKGVNTMAVDKFNRGFTINLATVVTAAPVTVQTTPASTWTVITIKGSKFAAEYADRVALQDAVGEVRLSQSSPTLTRASYSFTTEQGTSFGFGTGSAEGTFLGLDSTGATPLNLTGDGSRFNAPYFNLAENARHMGYGLRLGSSTLLRVGAVVQPGALVASAERTKLTADRSKSVVSMELQKNFGDAIAMVSIGRLAESNTLLGTTGAGGLALSGAAQTQFVTLSGALPISAKTSLAAMWSSGRTGRYANQSISLIDGVSASTSSAWSLGLSRTDVLNKGDRFGLTVAMPLRTQSGTLDVTVATSQSQLDGSLSYATQRVSLVPTGRERSIELAYVSPLRFGGELSAVAQVRLEPGHDAGAASQYGAGIRYVRSF